MEMSYEDRYYARLFGGQYNHLDVVLDKDQLLSLAALLIDLQQDEWLEEIKVKLQGVG